MKKSLQKKNLEADFFIKPIWDELDAVKYLDLLLPKRLFHFAQIKNI